MTVYFSVLGTLKYVRFVFDNFIFVYLFTPFVYLFVQFVGEGLAYLKFNFIHFISPDSIFKRTSDGRFGGTRLVNSYFREYMQYLLSSTEEFGDSDNESYDLKRMYYLEKFAKDFMKLKRSGHPAIIYKFGIRCP